jgi:hypothetical protein
MMYEIEKATCAEGQAIPTTVTQNLERERDKLQRRLYEVETVLAKLKAKPEVQEVLDALSQLGHRIY